MNFLPVMLHGLEIIEQKAFNIARNTAGDFVNNVKSEFGFNKSSFTHGVKHSRNINHRASNKRRIM